ncbi:MAG: DUF2231 domain-containing protein [Gemmatimonadota bacterium]
MPEPLHPAVVHFPVVLAVLLPVVAIGVFIAIRRGVSPRSWLVVVAMGGALALSSWVAVETGEEQEEVVEVVVPEGALEKHEEAGEALLVTSGVLFLLLAAGMAPGRVGSALRAVSSVASLALVLLAYNVGRSGGELVYEHGAAQAYVKNASSGVSGAKGERERHEVPSDDDGRDVREGH